MIQRKMVKEKEKDDKKKRRVRKLQKEQITLALHLTNKLKENRNVTRSEFSKYISIKRGRLSQVHWVW